MPDRFFVPLRAALKASPSASAIALFAILAGVLVGQRRPSRRAAHVRHQLFEARSRRRGEGVANVPQVMEVQVREADVGTGLVPDAPEARAPQRPALRTDEDPAVLALLCELAEVGFAEPRLAPESSGPVVTPPSRCMTDHEACVRATGTSQKISTTFSPEPVTS
jgi:hypothetical protein